MFKADIFYKEVTPSDGGVSFNTRHFHGEAMVVHVKPATNTTTWKMVIVGKNNLNVYESRFKGTGEIGEVREKTLFNDLYNEVLTVTISAASVDELFKVELRVKAYTPHWG